MEEVVEYEVGSDAGGGLDVGGVFGEEVPEVGDLEEEEGEPVQRGDYGVEREWSRMGRVLAPDRGLAMVSAIMRNAICIVNRSYDSQQPGKNRQNLVGPDSLSIVSFADCEWVCVGERHGEVVVRVLPLYSCMRLCIFEFEDLDGYSKGSRKQCLKGPFSINLLI